MKTKKKEFSKKIMGILLIINGVTLLFSFFMVWETKDLSPLSYIIPALGAETATATGFYYAKARMENKIKLMKANKVQPTAETFNEI